jgi:predicted metal-dependent peptidase
MAGKPFDPHRELAKIKLRVQAQQPLWGALIHDGGGVNYVDPETQAEWGMEQALAWTDGKSVTVTLPMVNGTMTAAQADYVLVHELVHKQHGHPQRGVLAQKLKTFAGLPYVAGIFDMACEAICNAHALATGIGTPPQGSFFDRNVTYKDTLAGVYQRYYQKHGGGGCGGLGERPGGTLAGDLVDSGDEPSTGALEAHDSRMRTATKAGLELQRQRKSKPGQGAGDYLLHVEKWSEPQVDWREEMAGLFQPWTGRDKPDFTRMNRRVYLRSGGLVVSAARRGVRARQVVLISDTSGSHFSQAQQAVFFREMEGILSDVRPRETIVAGVDYVKPKTWVTLEGAEGIENARPAIKGGGGTDFRPAFEWIKEQGWEPDAVVYVTDAQGPFPKDQPPYPVFWCVTTDDKVPWGRRIQVTIDTPEFGS